MKTLELASSHTDSVFIHDTLHNHETVCLEVDFIESTWRKSKLMTCFSDMQCVLTIGLLCTNWADWLFALVGLTVEEYRPT